MVREIRLADFCEAVFVDAAFEKVKQQSSAKHNQIFYLQTIKQIPSPKVAETLNVNVDQVYLIKHRLTKIFEEALKGLETKLGYPEACEAHSPRSASAASSRTGLVGFQSVRRIPPAKF